MDQKSKPRVYLYRKCSTCQNAIKWLEGQGIEFDEAHIYEQPPSRKELMEMAEIYKGEVRKLFNTSGLEYKAQNLKEKLPGLSQEQAIELLASNGRLVKRPFVLWKGRGAVGFKEEQWLEVLANVKR